MLAKVLDVSRVRIAATATGKYMSDNGFGVAPFPPRESKSGALRILSGRIARSLTESAKAGFGSEGFATIKTTKKGATLTQGSNVPYYAANEFGFSGQVKVPSHKRVITQAFGRSITPKQVDVKAHTKNLRIPARPSLTPALDDTLPFIEDLMQKEFAGLFA
ncbi:MAG: hypothetical protein RIE52_11910 [Balneola sp.]